MVLWFYMDHKLLNKAQIFRPHLTTQEIKEISITKILSTCKPSRSALADDSHCTSHTHVGRVVHNLLFDAAMGSARRACRMWCTGNRVTPGGMTYDVNGVRKYVSSGKSVYFPCKAVMREANGVHPNG